MLLALTLLLGAHAWAAKSAYGEDFVRLGQHWVDAGPLGRKNASSLSGEEERYHRQVEDIQDSGGPYSDALAEPLAALGGYYRASGDLERAMRLYHRALHVVRVNDGLYSQRQVPILREILDAYRDSGDLQALDRRYDYYFRLYGNGQPPYTDVRLRAALGYLRWQREALRLGMDGNNHQRLLALYHLNEELLQATSQDSTVSEEQYGELVFSQIRNLYLLQNRIEPRLEKIGIVATAPTFGGEWEQGDLDRRRLENLQRGALSRGSALLQELIARSASRDSSVERARLYLELGDWYQWHGNRRAYEQYAHVVKLLSDAGQQDLLQQWLGQPVELPDNGAFWQPPVATTEKRRVVFEAEYDVSARGRVSNLQATVDDPASGGGTARFKRHLKKVRFRPRWVGENAESVLGLKRSYEMFR